MPGYLGAVGLGPPVHFDDVDPLDGEREFKTR